MLSFRHALPMFLTALSLGFLGCDLKLHTDDPTSSLAQQEAGGISFRLNASEIAGFAVAVDSVRLEAERAGFATRSLTGGLDQLMDIPDLAAGTWNLKVALYDNRGQIQLYGDAVVQVLPGRTVDVVIHLRRASGSVRVRIILDDTLPNSGVDTLYPEWGANTPSWKPAKYWRTPEGIYLVSTLVESCEQPFVTYGQPTQPTERSPERPLTALGRSSLILWLPDQLVLGSKSTGVTVCPNLYQERIKFIPWVGSRPVTLYVPGDSILLEGVPTPDFADTVVVAPVQAPANYESLEKLPVLGAWRDVRGVYIETRYDCNAPAQVVETDMFTMNSGVVRFTPVRSGVHTMIGCGEAKHVLFVPTTYDGPHQVHDAMANTFIDLPGLVVPPKDTSAVVYRLNILRSDSVQVDYELSMDGTLRRTTTTAMWYSPVDSSVIFDTAFPIRSINAWELCSLCLSAPATEPKLRDPSLVPLPQNGSSWRSEVIQIGSLLRDSIQKILDLRAIRSLPAGQCVPPKILYREDPRPADIWAVEESGASVSKFIIAKPWYLSYRRTVVYADGKTSLVDLVASQCSTTTDLLSEVDDAMMALLPPYGN